MAAIPDTGGARCALPGAMRALSRVVVLGGLVVAGWLLGAGIGLAHEGLRQPSTGLIRLVNGLDERAAQADGGSGGQLGVPPMVRSAVTRVRSAVSVPQRSLPPPEKLGVVKSIVNAVDVPKPLAQVLTAQILTPQILAPLSPAVKYDAGIWSPAPADGPATPPRAEPAVRAAATTAPVATLTPLTMLTSVNYALPTPPICAAAPVADPFAGQLALGADPAEPVPASPPASAPSSCTIGSTGGGAGTKRAPDLAVNDSWVTADLAPMHRLLHLSTSDLPRSPAAQPSTSPD